MEKLPQLEQYTLQQIGDGVWAALATDGGAAWANSGILDLGDSTLVFDSGWTPTAGGELRNAAEQLTGHKVAYLVNSHMHSDHVLGNSAFAADTLVISSTPNYQLIAQNCNQVLTDARVAADQFIPMREAMLAAETDATRHTLLAMQVQRERHFVADLPQMRVRLPNLTFDTHLTLHGAKQTAELISYGVGHSQSDVLLHLPQHDIVFSGDLLSLGNHPSLSSGDPPKWLAVLERIERLGVQTVVPGHGPVATVGAFMLLRSYIGQLSAMTAQIRREGGTVADALALPIPPPFDGWQYPDIYAANIRFLYQQAAT